MYMFTQVKSCSLFTYDSGYFIGNTSTYLGGDEPSTIHLRAAKEKQNDFCRYIVTNKVTLGPLFIQLVWHILKQLSTSMPVKVVDR